MKLQDASGQWFVTLKANPHARLRLFCFPYAGGGAMIYRSWAGHLPSAVEVCAAKLPGREGRLRETPIAHITPLVKVMAEEIAPLLDKPFAFFGHSMGALIGFELARLLKRERGIEPLHLFVSGRRAPQLPSDEEPTFNLPQAEFIEAIRNLNGTPAEVLEHPELMELMIPLLRADFAVCQTYSFSPGSPLGCEMTVFGGLQDTDVPRECLVGWQEQTIAHCSVRMLPGDHFFLHSSQALLLRALNRQIERLIQVPQPASSHSFNRLT
jgi:medium-chain acyl-[acyl-carrier-protein] hydrolase